MENEIRIIVDTTIQNFALGFQARHEGEMNNPEGTINLKKQNVFLNALGDEFVFYSALVRSFDSSLGNVLENMAIQIAKLFYKVETQVKGHIYPDQINHISNILEIYKNREKKAAVEDYEKYFSVVRGNLSSFERKHVSDYYLYDEECSVHYLIELKAGGDLDNKKALAEKQALLEQYFILKNNLVEENGKIKIYFATAYNKYGEDNLWKQANVQTFFADEELLIGRNFWNFICKNEDGFDIVYSQYLKSSTYIKGALQNIRGLYNIGN